MQHQEGREATFSPVNFSKNWNHCFFEGRSCGQGSYCLFNIVNDPCEQNNLASRLPGKVQELLETFSSYNNRTVEPLLCPPDQRADPVFWRMCGPIGRTCWIRQKEGSSLETVMKRGLCDSGKGTREHERR